jgi:hypothetical protein
MKQGERFFKGMPAASESAPQGRGASGQICEFKNLLKGNEWPHWPDECPLQRLKGKQKL